MKPEFTSLVQVGVLVKDVDKAVRYYEEVFGMGPCDRGEMNAAFIPTGDMTIDGTPAEGLISKVAMLDVNGIEIELIQPVADTPYMRWLEKHGNGIHHVSLKSPTPYEELREKVEKLTGRPHFMTISYCNGMMGLTYLDLTEELGLIVEAFPNSADDEFDFE